MSNTSALLTVKDLSVSFGQTSQTPPAVSELNLELHKGKCLGLVGESGSGKSMTALAIMQLLPHAATVSTDSQILLNDQDILNFSERKMRQIRGKRIGMIFQDAMSAFNPVFTTGHQLRESLTLHRGYSRNEATKAAFQLLSEVGIRDPAHTLRAYPHELSGGMRQRAMIAMALCGDPDILIADEPTTALDVTIQKQVLILLKDLIDKYHKSLLFISHDLAVVAQLADDIAVMQHGKKLETNRATLFFQNPQHDYSRALLAAIPHNTARQKINREAKSLLTVQDLKLYFPIKKGFFKRTVGYVKAIDHISFAIPEGQTLALVGESGSGKTTTGKAILQLHKPDSGNIEFMNKPLMALNHRELHAMRQHMQIIFQDPYSALNPRVMVGDSIAEGLIAQKIVASRQAALDKIDQLLDQVELSSQVKWRYPHEFSGGQRQRICIARALALNPRLLILDEPTSALDVSIQMQILRLLETLQQEQGLSYLLITHDLGVVAYLAHHVAVMQHGKIVEHGETANILTHPAHRYTQQLLTSMPSINPAKNSELPS